MRSGSVPMPDILWPALLAALVFVSPACAGPTSEGIAREPVVGLPCEGCEGVFVGMPREISASERIAPEDEPGERMRIEGTVFGSNGEPVAGVIVYAFQTDATGIYPRDRSLRGTAASRHGRLRGWARTDEGGGYRFDTIRPGAYPDRPDPAHVHLHVVEPGHSTYYIDSIHFLDDPRLTPEALRRVDEGRGGSGLVEARRDPAGVWVVRRDIRLGEKIPGYPGREKGSD